MIVFFGTKFNPQELNGREFCCDILGNRDNRRIRSSAATSEEEALHRRSDGTSRARSAIIIELERVP